MKSNLYSYLKLLLCLFSVITAADSFAQNTIKTNPLPTNDLCAGSTINVIYSITGIYNAGNTFTAQLSDSQGSFANPINIGSVSATDSTPIIAAIPNVIIGDRFRIRVVSSSPEVIGSDNGADIYIVVP
ncbi:MAG: hypothetical protein ICV81_18250 [Flavisolibacter sp.]|nr:hypothetical protein [Flavisolibacter sp.]